MGAPLVVHIIYRLAIGGLENGLVNLINKMPPGRYRHVIVCMSDATDFRKRIENPDVEIYELNKKPGQDFGLYFRLWRLLRRLKPTIVHTRNIGTLETQFIAWCAGVRTRVHGEHGRDMVDIDGSNIRYQRLRKIMRPLIARYITVSRDLEQWLTTCINVESNRVVQIYNGVDAQRYFPAPQHQDSRGVLPEGFAPKEAIVIGTVGRMSGEKDQLTLLKAFIHARKECPDEQLRLVLVGDGPQKVYIESLARDEGIGGEVWFAGAKTTEVPEILRALDIFVLPSLGEGISNTILEAMASGLPVIATRVGGNSELVIENETGLLVPSGDPIAMSQAIIRYIRNPGLMSEHAKACRVRIEQEFSIEAMVTNYMAAYDAALAVSK